MQTGNTHRYGSTQPTRAIRAGRRRSSFSAGNGSILYVRTFSLITLALLLLASVAYVKTPEDVQREANPEVCEWIPAVSKEERRADSNHTVKNVVLFSDGTNFDDVVTLLFLAKSLRSRLVAVYLQGNAWASPGASIRHFYNMLHMMGPQFDHVPIFLGSYYAITDELRAKADGGPIQLRYRIPVPFGSSGVLYSDTMFGMGHFLPQSRNAYDIRKTPDEDAKSIPAFFEHIAGFPESERFSFLSIGTLTPIAKMFTEEYKEGAEKVFSRVDGLYVMGGAIDVGANLFSKPTNTKAEFNIYNDPHASQWAFGNLTERNVPVTLVPLDATKDVPIQPRLLDELRFDPNTPEAQLTGRIMENLRDTWFEPDLFFQTAFLWDPSSAIVMLHQDVVVLEEERSIRVVIEEGPDGPEQGWTKPCEKENEDAGICFTINVVSELDGDKVTDALLDTLQRPENSACHSLVCL